MGYSFAQNHSKKFAWQYFNLYKIYRTKGLKMRFTELVPRPQIEAQLNTHEWKFEHMKMYWFSFQHYLVFMHWDVNLHIKYIWVRISPWMCISSFEFRFRNRGVYLILNLYVTDRFLRDFCFSQVCLTFENETKIIFL